MFEGQWTCLLTRAGPDALHVHTICTQPCTDARGDGGRASRIQVTTEYVTRVAVDMHADCPQPCTDATTRGDLAQKIHVNTKAHDKGGRCLTVVLAVAFHMLSQEMQLSIATA